MPFFSIDEIANIYVANREFFLAPINEKDEFYLFLEKKENEKLKALNKAFSSHLLFFPASIYKANNIYDKYLSALKEIEKGETMLLVFLLAQHREIYEFLDKNMPILLLSAKAWNGTVCRQKNIAYHEERFVKIMSETSKKSLPFFFSRTDFIDELIGKLSELDLNLPEHLFKKHYDLIVDNVNYFLNIAALFMDVIREKPAETISTLWDNLYRQLKTISILSSRYDYANNTLDLFDTYVQSFLNQRKEPLNTVEISHSRLFQPPYFFKLYLNRTLLPTNTKQAISRKMFANNDLLLFSEEICKELVKKENLRYLKIDEFIMLFFAAVLKDDFTSLEEEFNTVNKNGLLNVLIGEKRVEQCKNSLERLKQFMMTSRKFV